jgi:hypothetical protein
MTQIPRPDLHTAIETLANKDEFDVVVEYIVQERERFLGDFRQAESPHDVMKIAGSVAALDELIQVLTQARI